MPGVFNPAAADQIESMSVENYAWVKFHMLNGDFLYKYVGQPTGGQPADALAKAYIADVMERMNDARDLDA